MVTKEELKEIWEDIYADVSKKGGRVCTRIPKAAFEQIKALCAANRVKLVSLNVQRGRTRYVEFSSIDGSNAPVQILYTGDPDNPYPFRDVSDVLNNAERALKSAQTTYICSTDEYADSVYAHLQESLNLMELTDYYPSDDRAFWTFSVSRKKEQPMTSWVKDLSVFAKPEVEFVGVSNSNYYVTTGNSSMPTIEPTQSKPKFEKGDRVTWEELEYGVKVFKFGNVVTNGGGVVFVSKDAQSVSGPHFAFSEDALTKVEDVCIKTEVKSPDKKLDEPRDHKRVMYNASQQFTYAVDITLASGREISVPGPTGKEWELVEQEEIKGIHQATVRKNSIDVNDRPAPIYSSVVDITHEEGKCFLSDMGRIINQTVQNGPFETRFSYVTRLRKYYRKPNSRIEEYSSTLPALKVLW